MKITKSSGVLEALDFNKVPNRIRQQTAGLSELIDVDNISKQVINGLVDGISTNDLDDLTANICASYTISHPDYGVLGGRILMSRLHKSNKSLDTYLNTFSSKLNSQTLNTIIKYKLQLSELIDYNKDFNFDFFAVKSLKKIYLLRTTVNEQLIYETPQQMYIRIACNQSDDLNQIKEWYEALSNQLWSPASPILINAGTINDSNISCNLTWLKDDSLEGTMDTLKNIAKASAGAAGIGFGISNLRSQETTFGIHEGTSHGVVKLAKIVNELMRTYNQSGKRTGSCALYLDIWHLDILSFLKLKLPIGSEELRTRDLFLAVNTYDNFWRAIKNNTDYYLFCPDILSKNGVKPLYELYGEEFENEYNRAVDLGLGKRIPASELFLAIQTSLIESGVPYLTNLDAANRTSNHNVYGKVKMSNLCVAPETLLLTDKGYTPIGENEGKTVNIWNSKEWSEVKIVKTSDREKLIKITFSNDAVLYCTEYHKFNVETNTTNAIFRENSLDSWEDINVTEKRAAELNIGDIIEGYKFENVIYHKKRVVKIEDENRYDATYCVNEPKLNKAVFNGILTKNCNEILQFQDAYTTAQCVLSSIPVKNFIKTTNGKKEFDYIALEKAIKPIVYYLNKVIDNNNYPYPEAIKGASEQRAIAIGTQGEADLFAELDLPFVCEESKALTRNIAEVIYFAALKASLDYAREFNVCYKDFDKSNYSKGLFHWKHYITEEQTFLKTRWTELEKEILEVKMLANSLTTAKMPTASSSALFGNNEAFEPFSENLYTRSTLSGETIVVNKYLIKDLIHYGIWGEQFKNHLIQQNGSIQNTNFKEFSNTITDEQIFHLKNKFKTIFEISQKPLIDFAAERQIFVDQSQSMNLYLEKPTFNNLSSMLVYANGKKLKSIIYYLRSKPATEANKMLAINTVKLAKTKPIDSNQECFGCGA
jgi:ribonucleotide reductase alpha subunit